MDQPANAQIVTPPAQEHDTSTPKKIKIFSIFLVVTIGIIAVGYIAVQTGLRNESTPAITLSAVKSIYINSKSSGWGLEQDDLTILCESETCSYQIDNQKISIDSKLIERLLLNLNERVVAKVDVASLGITKEWLESNFEEFSRTLIGWTEGKFSEKQKQLVRETFTDIKKINDAINAYYKSSWTDDYPSVVVEIRTKKEMITISSEAQQLFMIPWEINIEGRKTVNYNHHISETLARLLQDNFPNKSRLQTEPLQGKISGIHGLVFSVARDLLEHELEQLDITELSKSVQQLLSDKFIVDGQSTGYFFGYDSVSKYKADAWLAKLRLKNPQNIWFEVALPLFGHELTTTQIQIFSSRADEYIDRIKSITWLQNYLSRNPDVVVEILFDDKSSINSEDRRDFATFAGELCGAKELMEAIDPKIEASVKIRLRKDDRKILDFSEWLVLPNSDSVLLEHDWNATNVLSEIKPEAGAQVFACDLGVFGTGLIVSPEGKVISDYHLTSKTTSRGGWKPKWIVVK